jgi:AcrR family transcriptional regulator
MAATGAKTERRHVQGDESRDRIVDAATEIASARGYHGTSIAAVSKLSGLPASSIYWHFGDKDGLIAAVIRRSFDSWLQSNIRLGLRTSAIEPHQHLMASMRHQAQALVANPEFLRLGLMLALERSPTEPSARAMFLEVRAHSLAALVEGFDRMLTDVHGAPDPVRARRIATIAMAGADGLFIAHQVNADAIELDVEFGLLAEMIWSSLSARP